MRFANQSSADEIPSIEPPIVILQAVADNAGRGETVPRSARYFGLVLDDQMVNDHQTEDQERHR